MKTPIRVHVRALRGVPHNTKSFTIIHDFEKISNFLKQFVDEKDLLFSETVLISKPATRNTHYLQVVSLSTRKTISKSLCLPDYTSEEICLRFKAYIKEHDKNAKKNNGSFAAAAPLFGTD